MTSTHLVGVTVEVKVLQEAGGELTEECVVGFVDGPQAPVRVVVGACARTESTHWTTTESVGQRGTNHSTYIHTEQAWRVGRRAGRPSPECFLTELIVAFSFPCVTSQCVPGNNAAVYQCFYSHVRSKGDKTSVYVRVQKGAVCQWSLLCVKHVRPGRLQSSPFLCRFFTFLSFFRRRISLYNWAFPSISCAASLLDRKHEQILKQCDADDISAYALCCQ